MSQAAPFSAISFRDPDGVLERHEGRILRLLRPEAAIRFDAILTHPAIQDLMKSGDLVMTWCPQQHSRPLAWSEAQGTVVRTRADSVRLVCL